jgi:hypothetical protein
MGWSDKKQTTQTTQNTTGTTTPNVPDWIQQPAQTLAGGIDDFAKQGSTPFTPQTNDLQKQAWGAAANLGSNDAGYGDVSSAIGNVGNVTANDVTGESLLTGLDQYYNPFKEQITNPVLSDFDFQAGQTRASQAAQAAGNQAFRGSRYGVQEAQTEGDLARARAATEGGLLQNMFTESTGLSAQDAARRQAAATSNQGAQLQASMANQSAGIQKAQMTAALQAQKESDARANTAVMTGAGQNQFDIANQIKEYPIEFQKKIEGLLQGLNPALFTGQTITGSSTGSGTTTANQGLGAWIGDALVAAASGAGKAAAAGAG